MHLYCLLHCNCSSVDSSLSESLHTFFVTTKEVVYFVYSLHTLAFCIIPTSTCLPDTNYPFIMAATTRSGAPTTTPAAVSRATKATKTTKASKAKGGKKRAPPKASNRVQKPAATGRNQRGYVYINDDSRTVSPDFIPETPPPSGRQRVVAETPPPSNQEYESMIARLQRKLRQRRQSSRHRHRSREDIFGAASWGCVGIYDSTPPQHTNGICLVVLARGFTGYISSLFFIDIQSILHPFPDFQH